MRRSARVLLVLLAAACQKEEPAEPAATGAPARPQFDFPLPDDLDTIDFQSAFVDAVNLMITVNTMTAWAGHETSLDTHLPGCPDFWTGQYEEAGIVVPTSTEGVSWRDDCLAVDGAGLPDPSGLFYDGWVWWDFDVIEEGDPDTLYGRFSDASRSLEGNGVVGDVNGVRYEFDGTATDTLYALYTNGNTQPTTLRYSSTMDATVTGTDMFDPTDPATLTPRGYRTDLIQSLNLGDSDDYEASGNVYMFENQILDRATGLPRFDSIGVEFYLPGEGSLPTDCQLEPLGWIGLRDPDAIWYDVVFLPRFEDDLVGEEYPNDPLSQCDGCGRLYVQGEEQPDREICVDFSFVFDPGVFVIPDADDYVLPIHAL